METLEWPCEEREGEGSSPTQERSFSHSQTSVWATGIKGSQKLVFVPFPSHCFISLLLSHLISTVFMFSDRRTEAGNLALGFRDVYDIEELDFGRC